jgi:mRNA-degrading endonuclease RelE of RelBE toxin-antitoxin system
MIRSLKEFYNLHQNLIEISSSLEKKYKKLPTINRNLLTKAYDENKIDHLKTTLNDYLEACICFKIKKI